jgi:sugar phosphate isomerase/epimerase
MQLAIGTCFDYQVAIIQQLTEIAATPFQIVSLGGDAGHSGYLTPFGRERLLNLSRQADIAIDSLHVPLTAKYDLACSNAQSRMAALCRVALCLEAAAELGATTAILHLSSFDPSIPRDRNSLMTSLAALIETAEKMKIRVAAENLWDRQSLQFLHEALAEYRSDYFGFCYDSSHDQLSESPPYAILEQYIDRLSALHLSDNDGQDDRHWLPFTGIVDWERICRVLRAGGYSYPLLLEVENSDGLETRDFLKRASDAAIRLQEMILG